jgi:serine/threonine protein kinase
MPTQCAVPQTNVLLDDGLRACLADFGLSRMMDTAGGFSGGSMLNGGSLRWAAPETFLDVVNPENMRPTVRSDVYSLASVWWEVGMFMTMMNIKSDSFPSRLPQGKSRSRNYAMKLTS